MADFHATLAPNIASSGDTLTLTFDDPQSADDVVVEIQEVDLGDEDEPKGAPSLVGRFYGKIDGGDFKMVPRKKGANPEKNPKAGKNAPPIKISVDGQVFTLDLPGKDQENGVFELRLKISGKKRRTWIGDAIIYVRDFNHFVAKGQKRPVVTFITDVDTTENKFFTAALKFWKKNADAVYNRPGISMAQIWDFLSKNQGKFGNWGEVNIVAHGNIMHILIRLLKGDPKILTEHSMTETFGPNPKGKDLSSFTDVGLDANSRVVFRACEAGNHAELLTDIQTNVMKGKAPLFVPKFLQAYTPSAEWFVEMLFFFVPGEKPPKKKADTEAKIKEQFDAKHPKLDWDTEKKTFSQHTTVLRNSFDREILEVELFKDKASGDSMTGNDADWTGINVVPKDKADLVKDMEKLYDSEGLDTDDEFWLVPASEWHIEPGPRKFVKQLPETFWLTLSGAKAKPKFRPLTGGLSVGSKSSNDWVVNAKNVAAEHFIMNNSGGTLTIEPAGTAPVVVIAGGKKMVVTAGGSATVSGNFKISFGSAVISGRAINVFKIPHAFTRCMVHWRRDLKIDDPGTPYKSRDKVEPKIGNAEHYGQAG